MLAIPLYALGYKAVANAARAGAPTLARMIALGGLGVGAIGAVIHGLTTLVIRTSLAAGAAGAPPLEAVGDQLAGLPWEWRRSFLLPAAPNLAHVAFFALASKSLGGFRHG